MITPTELKKLRESLPDDYASLISLQTGLSKSLIYKVIQGSMANMKVIDAAIELAVSTKEKLSVQKEAINKL